MPTHLGSSLIVASACISYKVRGMFLAWGGKTFVDKAAIIFRFVSAFSQCRIPSYF